MGISMTCAHKYNQWLFLLVAFSIITLPCAAQAKILDWHSTNLQLLRGWDYKLGDAERTIVTLEHANKWAYGDNFFFLDATREDDGDTNFYLEYSPRLSLGKILGRDLSYGIIKDVLVSAMLEKPEFSSERYLYGASVDLNLPAFTYFSLNLYVRDHPDLAGTTHQLTVTWKRPFRIGGWKFVTEGFADFAGREDTARANELIVPRILLDVGHLANGEEEKLFLGVEWQYWHNKFGVAGVTESVPQMQLKWVF